MSESTQDETVLQHTTVGKMLAAGNTNGEILAALQVTWSLAIEDAQLILRSVYDSWSSTRVGLNLQTTDDRNWHQFLRMQLLQKALIVESVPSQNLALRILDSLAGIQGISTTVEQPLPLPIVLVEAPIKEEEKEKENSDGS